MKLVFKPGMFDQDSTQFYAFIAAIDMSELDAVDGVCVSLPLP